MVREKFLKTQVDKTCWTCVKANLLYTSLILVICWIHLNHYFLLMLYAVWEQTHPYSWHPLVFCNRVSKCTACLLPLLALVCPRTHYCSTLTCLLNTCFQSNITDWSKWLINCRPRLTSNLRISSRFPPNHVSEYLTAHLYLDDLRAPQFQHIQTKNPHFYPQTSFSSVFLILTIQLVN